MILLDTNVLSEPLKPRPDPGVIAWLDRQAYDQLCISAVNVMEMLDGAARRGASRRRRAQTAPRGGHQQPASAIYLPTV
jgi:predicted nucleic acid-binding protein